MLLQPKDLQETLAQTMSLSSLAPGPPATADPQALSLLCLSLCTSPPQAIIYEGQDKNPEMCRVLLTHEIMCR